MKLFLPKHARTHLPGGSDPLDIPTGGSVAWVRIQSPESTAVPIADASQTQVNFDEDLTVGSDGWEAFFDIGFTGGGQPKDISPLQEGFYCWTAEAKWDDDFSGPKHLELTETVFVEWSYSKVFSAYTIAGLSLPGTQTLCFSEYHPGGCGFELVAAQGSGVGRDINGVYLQMAMLGDSTIERALTGTDFEQ